MSSWRNRWLIFFLVFILRNASALDVDLQVCVFKGPDRPFLEMSFYVLGQSITPILVDSLQQGKIEVLMTCRRGSDIILADKYILIGPVGPSVEDFMDVRRYGVDTGAYLITYECRDLGDTLNVSTLSSEVDVYFTGAYPEQSDIKFLSAVRKEAGSGNLVRNGIYMEPLPFNFYHRNLDQLIVYHEIYSLDELSADRYYATLSVSSTEHPEVAVLETHKILKPASVNPLLRQVDITDLPSGNYLARMSVHNSKRDELASRTAYFQRSNPERDVQAFGETAQSTLMTSFTNEIPDDSLIYCLRAIAPVVTSIDNEVLNYVIRQGTNESKRFFLHRYWTSRSVTQPQSVFEAYMDVARAIDRMYNSGFGYGFETDRGHIYLKYGRPDDVITVLDEPSAPPYEIWFYNQFEATHQANVRFLFYNPSLADNDYILLHSTAIGERSNPRWEITLYGSAPNQIQGSDYISGTRMQDNFFRNARRYFEGN